MEQSKIIDTLETYQALEVDVLWCQRHRSGPSGGGPGQNGGHVVEEYYRKQGQPQGSQEGRSIQRYQSTRQGLNFAIDCFPVHLASVSESD